MEIQDTKDIINLTSVGVIDKKDIIGENNDRQTKSYHHSSPMMTIYVSVGFLKPIDMKS